MREPGRRREALTVARLKVENQMRSLLARFGIADFRPRLKKAPEHLEKLGTFDGRPLPLNIKASLERLMAWFLSEQLEEYETARERVLTAVRRSPSRRRMIQLLAGLVGVGVERPLVQRICFAALPRPQGAGGFRRHDRHALRQRRSRREQGLSKNGNAGAGSSPS